jgi:hypothetical protein
MTVDLIAESPTMTLTELIDTVCSVLEAPMISKSTLYEYLNDRLCRIHDGPMLQMVARSAMINGVSAGYSPMLNPIDECFNVFKSAVRHPFIAHFRRDFGCHARTMGNG